MSDIKKLKDEYLNKLDKEQIIDDINHINNQFINLIETKI